MKSYVYFISCAGQSERGFVMGNAEATVEQPITNIDQINSICMALAKKWNWSSAYVLNYQLLRKEG